MSGGSSSSSNATSTTNVDQRQVVGDGSAAATASGSGTVNIQALDGGSIDRAFDFASNNANTTAQTFSGLLGFSKDVLEFASASNSLSSKALTTAAGNVGEAYKTAAEISTGQRYLTYAGLAVLGLVAVTALGKH